MKRILTINASYREDGVTDQIVGAMVRALQKSGAEVESVLLRHYPIEFCRNCRECTQQPGTNPGRCILHDGMQDLIEKIERADGYILASPTNFGSATAIYKRFMERLVAYAFWPWGKNMPALRKANAPKKKAVLVSSCAAPGIIGRWLYGTHKQLNVTAKTIGADPVGTLFIGLIGKQPQPRLLEGVGKKAKVLAEKLV